MFRYEIWWVSGFGVGVMMILIPPVSSFASDIHAARRS
jgi:hypothetical protein